MYLPFWMFLELVCTNWTLSFLAAPHRFTDVTDKCHDPSSVRMGFGNLGHLQNPEELKLDGSWCWKWVTLCLWLAVCELENGHRNSGFCHGTWWFSIIGYVKLPEGMGHETAWVHHFFCKVSGDEKMVTTDRRRDEIQYYGFSNRNPQRIKQ